MNSALSKIRKFLACPAAIYSWVIIVLIIPNAVLNLTEHRPLLWQAANILVPAGIYMSLMSISKKIGVTTLAMLPFMVLGAFQLVLSYLYGESVIAVDMFLNVVTTNVREINELLGNLIYAIGTVVLLYIPPIIWGIAAAIRHMRLTNGFKHKAMLTGCSVCIVGIICSIGASVFTHATEFKHEIFPVNAVCNLIEAFHRTAATNNYPVTSADFSFNATSQRDSTLREVYVMVIGETSRAINWQLNGYARPTNPRLSTRDNLFFFTKAISESNTTHKSVPMILSSLTAENFDSIVSTKSIISAMKEAEFYTHFFSNQAPNRSFTEYFGNEADDVRYADFAAAKHPLDHTLSDWLKESLSQNKHNKEFFVLHTYGSHFLYRDRYTKEFAKFLPDDAVDANAANRASLINGYDNSILYTDAVLDAIIESLDSVKGYAGLLYSSDHGEDIFDDRRNRFLHASPSPTYYQLHVAALAWMNDSLASSCSGMAGNIQRNGAGVISPQRSLFHTALQMAGVNTPAFIASCSLADSTYTSRQPIYLTDLNRPVPLRESGVKEADKKLLHRLGIK